MNKNDKKLLKLFRELPAEQASQLLDYAEFLHQRHVKPMQEVPVPIPVERPAKESVVAAVKRLSASYPMLNKDRLLNETASLMSQHLVQGRDAVEVIDELEAIFLRHYTTLCETVKQQGNSADA